MYKSNSKVLETHRGTAESRSDDASDNVSLRTH